MDDAKMREIKLQLRRHMNGEVAMLMKNLDNSYKANYGVSLQHAKDIAAQEELTAEECQELWQTKWRDLMLIAAAALAKLDPEVETVMTLTSDVPTLEMAEALPFLLTGTMSRALPLAQALEERNAGYDFAVAANTLGRAMARHHRPELFEPTDQVAPKEWMDEMDKIRDAALNMMTTAEGRANWTYAEARGISFLARQFCRLRRYGDTFFVKYFTDRLANNAAARAEAHERAVAEEIEAENEMLDSLC